MSEHNCSRFEASHAEQEGAWFMVTFSCIDCGRQLGISQRVSKAVEWDSGDGSCKEGDE
mgnify:CR=1 FL=1